MYMSDKKQKSPKKTEKVAREKLSKDKMKKISGGKFVRF